MSSSMFEEAYLGALGDEPFTVTFSTNRYRLDALDKVVVSLLSTIDRFSGADYGGFSQDRQYLMSLHARIRLLFDRGPEFAANLEQESGKILSENQARVQGISNRVSQASSQALDPIRIPSTRPSFPMPPEPDAGFDIVGVPSAPLPNLQDVGFSFGQVSDDLKKLQQEVFSASNPVSELTTPRPDRTPWTGYWDQILELANQVAGGYKHVKQEELAGQLMAAQAAGLKIQTSPKVEQEVKEKAAMKKLPWGWITVGLLGVAAVIVLATPRRQEPTRQLMLPAPV